MPKERENKSDWIYPSLPKGKMLLNTIILQMAFRICLMKALMKAFSWLKVLSGLS